MPEVTNNPQKAAEDAMEYELEGRRILLEAEEKSKDPLSRATFQFLADQELKHIDAIKAFMESLEKPEKFDMSEIECHVSMAEAKNAIKGIYAEFAPQFSNAVGKEEERQKIYEVAMEMEDHGHDFYENAANQAQDDLSRKLYKFLADEEINHFEIIQETKEYLKQPDAFMAIDENWMRT